MYFVKIFTIITTLETIVVVNPDYALYDSGNIWLFGIDGKETTTLDLAGSSAIIAVTVETIPLSF